MPFYKGDPNINMNGRPKGAKNRITEELREAFAMLLENNLEQYEIWLNQVAQQDPAKALDLALRISERFIPMLSRQEITGKDGEDLFKNVKFKFNGTEEEEPGSGDFNIDELWKRVLQSS